MSNVLDKIFISEDVFSEKMDNVVMALHGITATQGGKVQITTWKQIQQIVRMGLAPKFFSIGDRFIISKASAITITCSNSNVTATIDGHTFVEKMGEAGNIDYEATYDGAKWHDGDKNIILSQYGINLSGTPVKGDKLVVHETATDILFEVMGFDQEIPVDSTREHSMTLGMKYTFDGIVFDAPEAFFVNRTSAAIPAGQYNFKLKNHPGWASVGVGKYFQFTLANDLPVGGQLVFQQGLYEPLEGASIKVFSANTKKDSEQTEIVTMTEGQGGTYLGELKSSLALDSNDIYQKCFNHSDRALLGSHRWSTSAIRQWCNANAAKGTFWKPTNVFDRQPSWHDTSSGKDGFLYNLDPELVSVLGKCKKNVDLANCDRYTENDVIIAKETTEDLAWLFDRYEIQSCSSAEAASNPPYDYWHKLLGDTYGDRRRDSRYIKTNTGGVGQDWWLRLPNTYSESSGDNVRAMHSTGLSSNNYACTACQAVVVFAVV